MLDKWALIHRYGRLVKDGLARPFVCPNNECGDTLVYMMGNNDDMILWCPAEDHTFVPGIAFFDDVRAVVTEFYLE